MPRNSRHRSHKEHKHGERSDSDDRKARDRKERVEEWGCGSVVLRVLEPEKWKSSSLTQPSQGKDQTGADNGNVSVEHGRKRKDREEDSVASDRWNGAGGGDVVADLGPKDENFGPVESEKAMKSKLSAIDSRERSSRRHEVSTERHEDSSSRVESTKRRSEKDLTRDSSRRESSCQYKDTKDKERERGLDKDLSRDSSRRESSSQYKDAKVKDRERGLERDKKVHESRHERSNDIGSRNQGAKTGSSEEERALRKDKELTERQIHDELHNVELEKELEKHIRRRGDISGDRDKWQGDGRDGDDRRLSSRDYCPKNESYKNEKHRDERHKDGRYKDKKKEDLDRDQRHRDDRHRDERFSRDQTSSRSDNKHRRDENKTLESHKKSKLQDGDHGGSYVGDHSSKYKDSGGRKRSFDENDAYGDLRPRSAKESRGDIDRTRPEHLHSDRIDSNRSNNQPMRSPSSGAHAIKDPSRHRSRQVEPTRQDFLSGERYHSSAAIVGELAGVSGGCDRRTSDSQSLEKTKTKDHLDSGEYLIETAASSQYDKTRRSDGQSPSVQLTEKSQSTNDRQLFYRSISRCSHDIEDVTKKSSSYKGHHSQSDNSEHVSLGLSSFNRNGHIPGSSPSHLLPPPPVRHAIDSPVFSPYEDDSRSQVGERKSSSHYRKNSDLNAGRGQGNEWNSAPTWPSPLANGFLPFQNGPTPPGFPSAMQQFPAPSAPSLFGMGPYTDVTYAGISYHMHEASAHVRPFGWHNIMEDPYPQLQGWDGSSGVGGGDDSHAYGRQEWDNQNRHLMGSRVWETGADMWKVQNGNFNIGIPQLQESDYSTHSLPDDGWVGQSGNQSRSEHAHSESTEIKQSNDAPAAKNAAEAPPATIKENTPVPSKTAGDDRSHFCCNYLSKLDISADLASPELYKQCLTLLGNSEPGVCNISKHGYHQNFNDVNKEVGKSPNNLLSSLFPANTEAFFQRAMLLYKKQRETAKAMFPVVTGRGEDSPEVSNADKAKVVDEQPPEEKSLANASSCRSTEEEASNFIAEAKYKVPGDSKEQQNTNANEQGDHPGDANEQQNTNANAQGDHSGDAKEQHSDVISDAVVFGGGGSQACEAVMPECRVNLSRIPISPASTH